MSWGRIGSAEGVDARLSPRSPHYSQYRRNHADVVQFLTGRQISIHIVAAFKPYLATHATTPVQSTPAL